MDHSWKPEPDSDRAFYIQIADHIRSLVDSGFYTSGDKISEREIATQFSVSRNTVTRAFNILRDYGFLDTFEKSSTMISNSTKSAGSADWNKFLTRLKHNEVKYHEKCLIQNNLNNAANTLNMWSANNKEFGTLEIFREVFRRVALDDIEAMFYSQAAPGLPELRGEILKLVGQYGISASIENVFSFVSWQEALSCLAETIFSANTTVFHPKHDMLEGYSLFSHTQVSLCSVNTDGEGIIPDDFTEKLRHNNYKDNILYLQPINQIPTGRTMSAERMAEILSICRNKRIPIIENDILRDVTSFEPPKPFRAEESELVISLGATGIFSQVGLKCGWLIIPETLRYKLAEVKMHMYSCNQTCEIAAYELFKNGYYSDIAKRIRNLCVSRNKLVNAALHEYLDGYAEWNDTESVYRLITFNDNVTINEDVFRYTNTFSYINIFSLHKHIILDLISHTVEEIVEKISFIRKHIKVQ
jgi:GntR family transcriptional regulator of abcA and norABC